MFFGAFRPKGPVFVGNLSILLQICRKSFYTFSWKFLHLMFEIEKSLKSVGSMLPKVYTFGQKITQLALLISYLRWTLLIISILQLIHTALILFVHCTYIRMCALHSDVIIRVLHNRNYEICHLSQRVHTIIKHHSTSVDSVSSGYP